MTKTLVCWRCGEILTNLILPLSRREVCTHCDAEQHVCKLCKDYNPRISGACDEDLAEDVREKERANFCDYFSPRLNAFNSTDHSKQTDAAADLAALFGDTNNETIPDSRAVNAEDLFSATGEFATTGEKEKELSAEETARIELENLFSSPSDNTVNKNDSD